MPTTRFNSQIVPRDATEALGRLWIPSIAMYGAVSAAGTTLNGILGGTPVSGNGATVLTSGICPTNTAKWGPASGIRLPYDCDHTGLISFYVPTLIAATTTAADAVSHAMVYKAITYPAAQASPADGTAYTAFPTTAATANGAGITVGATTTNWDGRVINDGPFTIAAGTFSTRPDFLMVVFTATVVTFSVNENLILGLEMQYTRRFV